LRGRFDPRRLVREVLVTGPFAQWSRASVADEGGALLVGDAADFFDPFTGQGIYSALRGAELAADTVAAALRHGGPVGRAALAPYRRARRAAFAGKWVLERLIGLGVGWPALTERVVARLARRPDLADLLVGATGNFVRARAALQTASRFVVIDLAADQEHISRRVASEDPDRVDGIGYQENRHGIAVLDGVLASIECEKQAEAAGGDHTVFFGLVTGGSVT